MVQLNQGDVRRYVGVGSTVVGLVCNALSSSFNRLYGDWNSFKICAYIVSSSIICLAILLPEAWQRWRIFKYRALMTSLVMTFTTVYSSYLDKKMNMKPDAYGPISSAALATASLCMSKRAESVFKDLLSFFCGLLFTQLLLIKLWLGFVGAGFTYFMVKLSSYLDPPNRVESQPLSEVVIDVAVPLLESSARDTRPQQEEEGTDMVPSQQSSALDARPQEEEEGTDMVPSLQSSALDARPEEEEGLRDVILPTAEDEFLSIIKEYLDRLERATFEDDFENLRRYRRMPEEMDLETLNRIGRLQDEIELAPLYRTATRRRRQSGTRNKAVESIIPRPPRRVGPLNRTARRRMQ